MTQYQKMTETPVPKLILTLSVPTIISMMVTNIYNLVDTAFVGKLGTSASGAVGIVFGFMAVIQAFGFMFGQGSGSIVSRLLGKCDKENASLNASAGFFASFFCGLLVTVFGYIFLDDIVYFLGSTDTIAPYAKTYISYVLAAAPFMSSSFTLNNILRYEGKASLGMVGMLAGAVLNMAGDPIFMFAMNMGISGAGLSTALSQFISWLLLIGVFVTGRSDTVISIKNLCAGTVMRLLNIIGTGFPSMLRQGLNSLTTILLNSRCAEYGDAAVAAMSIVTRIIFFSFSIALGVGQGFQPVAGFNFGAGKYSRLKKAFYFAGAVAEGIVFIGFIVLTALSGNLISLFRDDPDVVAVGTRALRLQAAAQMVLPPCMMVEMLYQCTGKKLGASVLSSLRSGLLFIPCLLLLSHFRGLSGIQEAQPAALLLSLPVTMPFALHFFRNLPQENNSDPGIMTDK